MARRKKRRRGSSALAPIAAVLGIGLVAAAMAGTYYFAYRDTQKPAVSEIDLCPVDGHEPHLAILVDTTDPVTLTQLELARQHIEDKIGDAAIETRISFATVDPDGSIRQDNFFSMCKPEAGADVSILTKNPRLVEERFQSEFAEPIHAALDRLLRVPEASSSPIMEATQELAARIPGFAVSDAPRELLIMSDLVQHSEVFSFIRGDDWQSFVKSGGPTRFGSAFKGAAVSVLRVPRMPDRAAAIDDFWVRYFDAQGFGRVRVTQLGDL